MVKLQEKKEFKENEIGKWLGYLKNVLLFSPQESVADSCHSFSFQ